MDFKQSLNLLIVISLTLVAATIDKDAYFIERNPEYNLVSFMTRSNHVIQRNPTHSLECFDYYIPLINEIATQYENDYKQCCNKANADRSYADDDSLKSRNDLENRTEESCALLTKCKSKESVQEEYGCYINGGSESAQLTYAISTDASNELAVYKETLRVIEYKEEKCTNETKRVYENESQKAYAEFNSCILGNDVPKTTTRSTTTQSTTEGTTNNPVTPTTTDSPNTTDSSEEIDPPTAADSPYTTESSEDIKPNDGVPLFIDPIEKHIQKLTELKQHLYYL